LRRSLSWHKIQELKWWLSLLWMYTNHFNIYYNNMGNNNIFLFYHSMLKPMQIMLREGYLHRLRLWIFLQWGTLYLHWVFQIAELLFWMQSYLELKLSTFYLLFWTYFNKTVLCWTGILHSLLEWVSWIELDSEYSCMWRDMLQWILPW